MENTLSANATEFFKFQILVDHVKVKEALLVADFYSNSRYPHTNPMDARSIDNHTNWHSANCRVNGWGICHVRRYQDLAKMFALKLRSLVSLDGQLGRKGIVELECGAQVSRLLEKLPHGLRSSFRRYCQPQSIPFPTGSNMSCRRKLILHCSGRSHPVR